MYRHLGRSQTDFALQAIVECRAAKAKGIAVFCCAGMPMAVQCAVALDLKRVYEAPRWACQKSCCGWRYLVGGENCPGRKNCP